MRHVYQVQEPTTAIWHCKLAETVSNPKSMDQLLSADTGDSMACKMASIDPYHISLWEQALGSAYRTLGSNQLCSGYGKEANGFPPVHPYDPRSY